METRDILELDREIESLEEEGSTWATSYSDLMTLLLVFFVILISFSKVDATKLNIIQKVMRGEDYQKDTSDEIIQNLTAILEKHNLNQDVNLVKDQDGIMMVIKDSLLFASGDASISKLTRERMLPILEAFKELPGYYRFSVEGHTDDNPIHSNKFPSNWYLSSARSIAVLDLFKAYNFKESRLSAHAFADTAPLYANRTKAGLAIPENQKRNRRVVIRVK